MKRLLLSSIAVMTLMSLSASLRRFVVEGRIDNASRRPIVMIIDDKAKQQFDVEIDRGGSFRIAGEIDDIYPARFATPDGKFSVVFFIEPDTKYSVLLNTDNLEQSQINGGTAQTLHLKYEALKKENEQKTLSLENELMPRFMTAHDKGSKATHADSLVMNEVLAQFDATEAEYSRKVRRLMSENGNSVVTAYWLYADMPELSVDETQRRYALLGPDVRNSDIGRLLSGQIETARATSTGETAPDFTLASIDSQNVSLHKVKAKIKILDFWASWCGPCCKEMPNLVSLYNDFHGLGLEIVGVSLDSSRSAWIRAVNTYKADWIQLSDLKAAKSPVVGMYGVENIPFMLVLDGDNQIIAKNLRGEELRRFITDKLKTK